MRKDSKRGESRSLEKAICYGYSKRGTSLVTENVMFLKCAMNWE